MFFYFMLNDLSCFVLVCLKDDDTLNLLRFLCGFILQWRHRYDGTVWTQQMNTSQQRSLQMKSQISGRLDSWLQLLWRSHVDAHQELTQQSPRQTRFQGVTPHKAFDINLSLSWNQNTYFNQRLQCSSRQCSLLCFARSYLWFHGVIFIFLLFLFVLTMWIHCLLKNAAPVQTEGRTGKSLQVLPFMVSQFRHAPSCSVQLFITYDSGNMISWEEENSSRQPAIYTPLYLTQMKIKIVCVDPSAPT